MSITSMISVIASEGKSDDVFRALDEDMISRVGVKVFSCSTFDLATKKSARIFTNRPDIYPVSGVKEIITNIWTRTVLDAHETFVANTIEELDAVFPDGALIASIGCGSVVNLPVVCGTRFLGTVNFLNAPGHYSADKVAIIEDMTWAAQLAFLMHSYETTLTI